MSHGLVGAAVASASSPAQTESCRRAPPGTMAAILCQPSLLQSALVSARRSLLDTRTMFAIRGEASKTSMVWARVIRPASGVQSLSRPCIRRLAPAATIMAADVFCMIILVLKVVGVVDHCHYSLVSDGQRSCVPQRFAAHA